MLIPANVIANADDLGLDQPVNRAILKCFDSGYINSASLLTNMDGFDEAVEMARQNASVTNIGVHINLAEGKPLTNFGQPEYLAGNGHWDVGKTNKPLNILTGSAQAAFFKEISAQIERALASGIVITHIDSHYHIHTLPCFYKLFLAAAKQYKLKIRLAQTYNEGSYVKYAYRLYINGLFKMNKCHYSDRFETVEYFLRNRQPAGNQVTEIMLHPGLAASGALTDHYDEDTLTNWIAFLANNSHIYNG